MKNLIVGALLVCLSLTALGAPAAPDSYKVFTEEWAPYNYLDNDQVAGMTTEIVRAIMSLTGDDFEIVLMPTLRSTHILNTRPKTIMFSLFRTAQRERLYKWVGPIVEESIFPYQLASAPQIDSIEQLRQSSKITTRHGGLIPNLLENQGFKNLDYSAGTTVQLYNMLLARRTGVIIGDTPAGVAHYSRQLNIPFGTLRKIPVEVFRSSLYIAFSADCDDTLVATWARALEKLRNSGQLDQIKLRYARQL